jgi:tetratricopeptide (TPR) repeat protein
VDPQLVGDLVARANEIQEAKEPKDIDVSAVCEAVEAIYRKTKSNVGIDAARRTLEGHLGVFSTLANAPRVSPVARRTAIHHHAKALRNLKRFDEAVKLCETILATHESPATKLLLARLLLSASDPTAPARAKQLLFELLEHAQASPESAEISVTLAAIETLGRWQLKQWHRESLYKFGDLVADYIVASAERGFDLAFVAFAAIGRELRYNDPERFVKIFERLPRRTPEEAVDDQELAAWGDILLSASEIAAIGRAEQLATQALQFYGAISNPKPYHVQQRGHALVFLGRDEEAATVLRPVVASNPNPWNRYWLSKALFALGDRSEAIRLIDDALADPKSESFRAAMLQHRWEIRKAQGDPAAVENLKVGVYGPGLPIDGQAPISAE